MKAFAALFAAAVCLLAIPVTALGAEFTVNSTAEEPDIAPIGTCITLGGNCTLRAAVEESNATSGTKDTIKFSGLVFEGLTGDTIELTSSLTVTSAVKIDGKFNGAQCNTSAGVKGPCAEIDGPAAGSALVIENANDVEIEGIAITNAIAAGAAAINVINSSEEFDARGNWVGVKLDGSAGGNLRGIFIDPNSNGATIGGETEAARNVISNNSFEGLDIEGADNADVLGNYFGVKPDGATAAANAKDIEITDTVAFEANGNEVGTTVASGPAPCDGGCNVISGAAAGPLSSGIDLQGNGGNEEPATGPTTVHGNFIGLNAAGTATVANSIGVYVGKAEDVLVGGPENADANFIAGGGEGITAENAEGFEAIGNIIGSGAAGAEITAPAKGVFALNTNNANRVAVSGNTFDMDGGTAIQVNFGGTDVLNNFIEGAELGIWTNVGPNAAGGNLIKGNVIGESLAHGIWIEDAQNEVLGNAVYKSADSGILLELPVPLLFPTENLVGGNTAADQNNINESGGPAIEIVDQSGNTEEDSLNEVGRNKGAKNAGLFIDLVGAANAGILPPFIAAAKQAEASGVGAEPGALIRVFRKNAAEAGELESFLGEVVADGGGNWKVTYAASIPAGTIVGATQTSAEGATSELSTATTVADPSNEGGGSGGKDDKKEKEKGHKICPRASGGCGPRPVKPSLDTAITKGPKGKVHSTTAKFKFVSNAKGATFECKLDRKPFKPCKSPKTYKKLKPGKHIFKVRAVKGKKVDPTPAKRKFKVLK